MANIRISQRLDRVSADLRKIVLATEQYQGIRPEEARALERQCDSICEEAARIAAECRRVAGDRSADRLVKRVRKALGYTFP